MLTLGMSKAKTTETNPLAIVAWKPPTRGYANDQMNCDKDCFTTRCGLGRLKKEPCSYNCKTDCNPCETIAKRTCDPCKPLVKPKRRESKFDYAFRDRDNFDECCFQGHLAKPPCSDALRVGFKYHRPRSAYEMLFWKPECCPPCEPEPPRFDELYYKMRRMCEREYFPTWSECPKPRIVPKVVCCYERDEFEVPRRIRCKPPVTACPLPDALNRKLTVCRVGGDPNCVKVYTPCCCPARNPPKCKKVRQPPCVGRLSVPSPSFADCCRPPSNPDWPRECKCLIVDPLCGYPPLPPKPIRSC